MSNVKEDLREYSSLNIYFEIVLPKLEKGQSDEVRKVRNVRQYFCNEKYMLLPKRIIVDKAGDMPTVAFTIDVEKNSAKLSDYMDNPKERIILPIEFYHKSDWRDINFSVIVEDGHITHLVERGFRKLKNLKAIEMSSMKAYTHIVD